MSDFFSQFVQEDEEAPTLPSKKVQQLPTIGEIRRVRDAYKATVVDLEEPPAITDILAELEMEQYSTAIKKLHKNENWERVWWGSKNTFTNELAKAEEMMLSKAAFDVAGKFDEYLKMMVNDIDTKLPAAIAQLAENVEYMTNKDLIAYTKMLLDLRKDYLDRVTAGKHVPPGKENETKQQAEKTVLSDLGLLANIAQTLRGKTVDEDVIDAEYTEEVEQTRKAVFAGLDS